MTRNSFDLKLQLLHQDLLNMSERVERQIENSIESLKKQSIELALQVIDGDDLIDRYEKEIEEKCVRMIATEQPLAVDLRRIFITTKIVTDLERMADHGVDIAQITIQLKNEEYIKELIDIPKMADIVNKMIKGAIEVYITRNIKLAYEVCEMDDEVDKLYDDIFKELIEIMANHKESVFQCSRFLFVCKYLERIADHATNICEQTLYLETGEKLKLN
ncbi:MAG: phosphate signaling complex protein PhoU [Clostridium sp.]|nr:phosphate signaling complex protein PhoU [Clostridium sp.]